jgi:ferredoxin
MTKEVSKKIVLYFSKSTWDKPIVYKLVKDFDLVFNILKAQVLPRQESYMVMELTGPQSNYRQGVKYLKQCGITVKSVDKDVQRDEELCYHCGACTAICPTQALHVDPVSMEVRFENKLCSGCGLCMPVCPSRAMQTAML